MTDCFQDLIAGLEERRTAIPQPTRHPITIWQFKRFIAWRKRTGKKSFWEFIIEEKELPC